MCMKPLNVNTCCYKNVTTKDNKLVSFDQPFSGIVLNHTDEGKFTTGDFVVVTQINVMGTNQEDHKLDNPLEQRKSLDFIIRLTKRDKDPAKQIGVDLDAFTVNLQEQEAAIERACYQFFNLTRVTRVKDFEVIGGPGNYIIKVLVKETESDKWIIQNMYLVNLLDLG